MTILTRLEQWKEHGTISPEQHTLLAGLSRGEPFSLFLELNILLYAGVLAFVAGLGWTVSTWSQQLGDVLVLTVLSAMLAACFWYCFSRAPAWSPAETPSPSLVFDYVLYLGSLTLVRGTRLHREPFSPALRTMGSLSAGDRRPLLLPRLSFRQPLRAVARVVLARRMVRAHHLALAVASGRSVPAIRDSLQPDRRRRRSHPSAPRPETAFLRHLSEHRGQRSLLGAALRRLQSGGYGVWFLALLAACGASLAWGSRAGSFPSSLMPPSTATWASVRSSSAT